MGCGASSYAASAAAADMEEPTPGPQYLALLKLSKKLAGGPEREATPQDLANLHVETTTHRRTKNASQKNTNAHDALVKKGNVEDDYVVESTVLGRGAFSIVKTATLRSRPRSASGWSTMADNWRRHGGQTHKAAVKLIQLNKIAANHKTGEPDERERRKNDVLNEINILAQVAHHPHVVGVYGAYIEPQRCCLVMELMAGGSVMDVVLERGGCGTDDGSRSAHPLLCAVAFLHGRGYCHRDIKPENLLLPHKRYPMCLGELKLGDFNLSRRFARTPQRTVQRSSSTQQRTQQAEGQPPPKQITDAMRTLAGTPAFLAPEVAVLGSNEQGGTRLRAGEGYDEKADVWSAACSLYLICTGHVPFAHSDSFAGVVDRSRRLPTFEAPVWRAAPSRGMAPGTKSGTFASAATGKSLLTSMLAFEPAYRPSAEECLRHAFVKRGTKGTAAPPPGNDENSGVASPSQKKKGSPSPRRIRSLRQLFVRNPTMSHAARTPSPSPPTTKRGKTVSEVLQLSAGKARKYRNPSAQQESSSTASETQAATAGSKAATTGRRARPPATPPRRDANWHQRRYQMAVKAALFGKSDVDDDAENERLAALKQAYVDARAVEAEEVRARRAREMEVQTATTKDENHNDDDESESAPKEFVIRKPTSKRSAALRSGSVMSPLKPINMNRMSTNGGVAVAPR